MSIKEDYYIKEVDKKEAITLIIKYHYLHRRCSCSFGFGLYERVTDRLIGVITYGKPASDFVCKGICGIEEKENVIELTRLWIEDGTPKNVESFLIGNTIKMIPNEIIVSYSEIAMGHLGIVYQATNWLYTGLTHTQIDWVLKGDTSKKHNRHYWEKFGGINEAKKILGDKMVAIQRPQKHRYIYFNCNKKRKKELLNKLKYIILKYPKNIDKAI
jgi:hypothetical protein